MINQQSIAIVLPAYNAANTLEQTYKEIPFDIVDHVILVDDRSQDDTIKVAKKLGIEYIVQHVENKGYGGNQKSCYQKALEIEADIVVMLHPDYQYDPRLIHSMCYLIANGVYEVVLGSRILGKGALKRGNAHLQIHRQSVPDPFQNLLMNQKLSEYHTGYRAFSGNVLRSIAFSKNSDDFVFDNQMLAQIFFAGFEIAEITCPTKYFEEASSINIRRSTKYGLGVLWVSLSYFLAKLGIRTRIFK